MNFELSNQLLFQPLIADIGLTLLQLLLFFVSLWLIFLILIQRGKGGGLTAAFGGGGGDSAFGAKAGDAFTKITIVSALVWITLCMVTIAAYNPPEASVNRFDPSNQTASDREESSSGGLSSGTDSAEEGDGEAETGGESTTSTETGSDTDSDTQGSGEDSSSGDASDSGSTSEDE